MLSRLSKRALTVTGLRCEMPCVSADPWKEAAISGSKRGHAWALLRKGLGGEGHHAWAVTKRKQGP
jgi:hypothetical protein